MSIEEYINTGSRMEPDEYINTISRMEPNITMVDRDAALASIAISLKRIADSTEANQNKLGEICSALWHIDPRN